MSEDLKVIKNKTVKAVIWKFLERFCAQGVSIIVSIILARILMPEDYSIVSIITIFFAFCNLFISGGLTTALIQKKDSDMLDYSTIFVSSMVMATIIYIGMFFCAPLIADLYSKPILTLMTRVMGLGFFINAYKSVLCAKISSDLDFGKFFYATIIGTIISAIVGVAMALNGFGPWALVAQQLSNSLIDTICLSFATKIRFQFKFSWRRFKGLFGYGGKVFAASFISTIYDECKPLIVGLKYSTVDLAYYNKGMTYPSTLYSLTSSTLSSALFPAMAKVQDSRDSMKIFITRFMRFTSYIICPVMLGMFVVGENFIKIILTEKWLPILPYYWVFCVLYMFELIQSGLLQSIRALGQGGTLLVMEIVKKTLYALIIAAFVLFFDNPIWIAVSSLACALVATIINILPNRKLIGYGFRQLFRDLFPNLSISILMAFVVYLFGMLKINMYLLFVLQIIIGIILYIVLSIVTKNENFHYLIQQVKEFLLKRKEREVSTIKGED